MEALDLKLLRSFRRLWAQALAIALVLSCGVAILLMAFGMERALGDTRAAYYERNRFADVFAQATRVPDHEMGRILAIDGVRAGEARVEAYAILDLPDKVETVTGLVLSLPVNGGPVLNSAPTLMATGANCVSPAPYCRPSLSTRWAPAR